MVNHTPVGKNAFKVASAVEGGGKEWVEQTIAFVDAKKKLATIHLINPTNDAIKKVSLDLNGKKIKKVRGYITSGDQNHVELSTKDIKISGRNAFLSLPELSFVTVELEY